jgi:putative (di)nucleoside polyphosphate hydrolase
MHDRQGVVNESITMSSDSPLSVTGQYRPCVGIALLNTAGQVFMGQRRDSQLEAWQMPQGGIDGDETPEQAAMRELLEETGTGKAEIIAEIPGWHSYDLPAEWQGRLWGGGYVGQRQKWLILRFLGTDADININTPEPEFCAWRWVPLAEVSSLIVPFKRDIYTTVMAYIRECVPGDVL